VSTEPQSTPGSPAQPQAGPQPGPQVQPGSQVPQHVIKHTRISGLWVAVAFFAVVLLLLLLFILQNARTVDIAYFGAHGHLPLGVALLLAAVCGALLAILASVARMAQLRATARRHRRADARRAPATSVPADPRG
jgi:lipopolysaccharide assembly protein A